MKKRKCRFCGKEINYTFVDLGMTPLANSYIPMDDDAEGEMIYPLHLRVCDDCFLVQMDECESPKNLFEDYAYFSSYSTSWLKHAKRYTEYMRSNYNIGENTQVIEIASNDGYLLQYFKNEGIPVLGIEPAANIAKVARDERGIPTISEFFGTALAERLKKKGNSADLLVAHNVLQHVPDINDFLNGAKCILSTDGILTLQFHYLCSLMEHCEFDTIYHEHYSYFSFSTAKKLLEAHGLRPFDIQEFPEHGGSIRIFACHEDNREYRPTKTIDDVLERESQQGIEDIHTYLNFGERVNQVKYNLLSLLIQLKRQRKTIIGYGAAAKGNTLLNYCGIRRDFLEYVADISPYKQNMYLPGSRIPVYSPEKIKETKPDYILILPWNLKEEIMRQLNYVREWGAKFILPVPKAEVL